jgi:hypothetical protein
MILLVAEASALVSYQIRLHWNDIEDTASGPWTTDNNIVVQGHCRVLILANNSDATGNDISFA